jgi:histidine phosphotransferase ChpT
MSADDPDLAALTGSRICHDLASPVGAALTGLDLLSTAPGATSPEDMALLRDSLSGARATLEMLRVAFGRAGEARGADTLGATVRGHLAARPRLRLDWALHGPLAPGMAHLVALAVLCAAHALPRGGTLAVARTDGQGLRVTATATKAAAATNAAPRLAADPALWDGLAGHAPLPAPDPRQVEFHLLAARRARGDARLTVSRDETTLAITLTAPAQD